MNKLNNFFVLIRPYQWLKNSLVLPLFFLNFKSLEFLDHISDIIIIFLCFSIFSSAVYCLNDIFDFKTDQKHPFKKSRPIALGVVNIYEALFLSLLLISIGSFLALNLNFNFFIILIAYLGLNIIYSFFLKHLLFIDCIVLTFFYLLRILAPASLEYIYITYWFLSFTFFLFLSLSLLKKYVDFDFKYYKNDNDRVSSKEIVFNFGMIAVAASLSVLVSFLNSSDFIQNYKNVYLIYASVIIYLFWIFNIWNAAIKNLIKTDPILFALGDFKSICSILTGAFIFTFSLI